MKKRTRLDEFRVKEEEGSFYIQQKIHVRRVNIFGKTKEKYKKWETLFDDCILYLDGETIGFGVFKNIKQAKKGIEYYRKEKGFLKKDIKYHYEG